MKNIILTKTKHEKHHNTNQNIIQTQHENHKQKKEKEQYKRSWKERMGGRQTARKTETNKK